MVLSAIRRPGPGAHLVLGHGVTDSAASLASQVGHYAGPFDVLALDARGHGTSPGFNDAQRRNPVGQMVDDAVVVLEELQAEDRARGVTRPVILMGHSMSGAVFSAVAARRPDLVAAVVLEEPAWLTPEQVEFYAAGGPATREHVEWVSAHPVEAWARNQRDYPAWTSEERAGWLQAKFQVDRVFVATGEVCVRGPWEDLARGITVPTLVVTSDGRDVLLGADGLRRVAALGNERLRTALVPGATHCVRRDQPAAFYRVVDGFLQELGFFR